MRHVFLALIVAATVCGVKAEEPLVFSRAIELPHVEGRIDHLTIDAEAHRLFVAALGNNTVEVIDLPSGRDVRSLSGFHEPQGIGQPLDSRAVAVANGGTGDLILLNRTSFGVDHKVPLGDDADNVRFDRKSRRFFVGYGSGAIGAVSEEGTHIGDVKLRGHPESFQLEQGGSRMFVNVPGAGEIAVVDRVAMKLSASWPVATAAANYPMALDEADHRLFVGCRRPAVVLTFDTTTGKQLSSTAIVGDTDDMFFDAKRKRLYVIGGEGFVDVLQRESADRLTRVAHLATAAGARTGLLAGDVLYVAVPHRGRQRAEVRLYEAR